MRKSSRDAVQIPAVKDFFKDIFTGHVTILDEQNVTHNFSFFNLAKYTGIIAQIDELNLRERATWLGSANRKKIWIDRDSPLHNYIREEFGDKEGLDQHDDPI